MQYQLVTTNDQLANVCKTASGKNAIALDTEFVRTRTLSPHLGLIQLYDGEQLVLIDPLSITNVMPFINLLENPNVIKVLHACSEDLETFLSAFDTVPTPVFDTQFAASVLGMGPTLGYAKLVETLCDKTLDKGESRTDWLARPLREAQLEYAANDVLYLLPCYDILNQRIREKGKLDWVYQEIALLADKKRAKMPEDFAFLQIKNNWRLSSEQLTVLQALAGWRLAKAREKDLALNFVFKESHLFDVAIRLPSSKSGLSRVHGIPPQTMRRYGDTIVTLVEEGRQRFEATPAHLRLPQVRRLIDVPNYKKILAALKDVATNIAQQQDVSLEVIASKKQLNQLLKWYWFQWDECRVQRLMPDVLVGWRAPLFVNEVERILGPFPVIESRESV
ncbi:ribonuclease D [Alteromonas sp. KUL49]|uniref:ribonuclease D n=1 Tax=Alteromonas sp. KUL49 TaxID=2480798 RepID=UPI00102F1780|nr:ribonuclease D [Alteromonas sp. KUL49]TAP35492.1 ribonuclease D [Alteromonas sp. KUL49]GEA13370.1 ribonuclease D [Alteromonas sp. KUL49]